MSKFRRKNEVGSETADRTEPLSVEELLPYSRPTKKNLESLVDEIRSGKYATSEVRRIEMLTKAGLMTTYLEMEFGKPIDVNKIRERMVEKGVFEEDNSFWGAKNLWIAVQTLGFVIEKENQYFLSDDFAPLYYRWKKIREQYDERLAKQREENGELLSQTEDEIPITRLEEKRRIRMAKLEAKKNAKEAHRALSEEKAKLKEKYREEKKRAKELIKENKRLVKEELKDKPVAEDK